MIFTSALLLSGMACVGAYFYGLRGHVYGAEVTLAQSEHFSDEDIRAAADTVLAYFEEKYEGCRLQNLRYSSEKQALGYAEPSYLTLYSDFVVYPVPLSERMTMLSNSQYKDFDWVLSKNHSGEWEIRTCGYC
ncbi:MAG: hypothetical protein IK130_06425 [Oscillospiraceae bacterium]|nr:hypothetical protein [Oscillospiraceae bacterium]